MKKKVEAKHELWSDPRMAEWHSPSDVTSTVKIIDHDFRIGGRRCMTFGSPTEQYFEDCRDEDIPDRRLCYAMTIARGDTHITTSMVTFEINPGAGSEVIVTDQIAILHGGETTKDREGGWGETLAKLTAVLRS